LIDLPGGGATDARLLACLRELSPQSAAMMLDVLARRGVREALPAVLQRCGSDDPALARAAYRALSRLGSAAELSPAVAALEELKTAAARADAEAAVARLLERTADAKVRSQVVLSSYRAAATPEHRASLMRLFPHVNTAEALAQISEIARDPADPLLDTAVRALADWPGLDAWGPMLSLYRGTTNGAHRTIVLRGLVRLADEANAGAGLDHVQRYQLLLENSQSPEETKLVLGALGGCRRVEALELALAQLDIVAVRPEAVQAVRRIADAIKGTHEAAARQALGQVAQD
jgi:hypothetical protein